MRATKWKKMKFKKAKSLARIGPDDDSNSLRNKRVLYEINILLNFQSPDGPPSPLDHGYYLINGLCVPIMYTKPSLPNNLASQLTIDNSYNDENSDYSTDSGDTTDGEIDNDGLDI